MSGDPWKWSRQYPLDEADFPLMKSAWLGGVFTVQPLNENEIMIHEVRALRAQVAELDAQVWDLRREKLMREHAALTAEWNRRRR